MRLGICFLGIALTLAISCDDQSSKDEQMIQCPEGLVLCRGNCITAIECQSASQGGSSGLNDGISGTNYQSGASGTGQIPTQTGGIGGGTQLPDGAIRQDPPIDAGVGVGGQTAAGSGGAAGFSVGEDEQPVPVALTCTTADGTITIAETEVVSDFRQEKPIMYQVGNRGGTAWYGYAATDDSEPGKGSSIFEIDPSQSGPCNSGGALHVSSPGNTDWGVGFGVNLAPDTVQGVAKGLYDASADGYTGFGFWMKCARDVEFTFFKIPDANNDADVENPRCSYDANPTCNQYGVKNNVILANQWTYYRVFFSETIQDWDSDWANNSPGPGLNAGELTAFQVQMNTKYMRDGSTRQANAFDCWIDDVHLLSTPAPQTPAASDTFTTQGNQILRNGSPIILKGLARPSFEWDPAGFGITREDIQRMKVWGPKMNVIRYSLNQGFWLNGHTDYNPLYQAYVDRAVQWALQEGLFVILDLHWTSTNGQTQMSDTQSITFWTQVANTYGGDGRIMFELYNEPHDIDPNTWLNGNGSFSGMQQMYDAIRATGASNLVMVGGLDWAYDLSHVSAGTAVNGTNIVYVTHPYGWKAPDGDLARAYGNVAQNYPVIATEFGYADVGGASANNCYESEYSRLLGDFNTRGLSWTGWAWLVDDTRCGFPTLIDSYSGTSTEPGSIVKSALSN